MSYETVTETAKKIRIALKAAFPSVKFSVRSESYSKTNEPVLFGKRIIVRGVTRRMGRPRLRFA